MVVIRLPDFAMPVSSADRYALDLLVDLSRLVPVDGAGTDAVRIQVVDGSSPAHARFEPSEGTVMVRRSVLRWIVDVAGSAIEQRSTAVDRYGRVPSSENPLVSSHAERDPVVSRTAIEFRDTVIAAAGQRPIRFVAPWPNGHRWAAALTHDLDIVTWWPVFSLFRIGELVRKGNFRTAMRSARSAIAAAGRAPVMDAVQELLHIERELGITSTWFILCGTPTARSMRAGDLTYRPESPSVRAIIAALLECQHEVGLHGSFDTLESTRDFTEQRARLEKITGVSVTGGRQHFLRMRPGLTQRAMRAAGFRYDASFGFPDRSGFRLGVADVIPAWDDAAGTPAALDEVPLVWMDRTLSKYHGLEDPRAWTRDALETAMTARSVEGLWVGLWHPNLVSALGFPGGPEAYRAFATELLAVNPYIASLDDLVLWRRARRAVRIARVSPSGVVEAYSLNTSPAQRIMLEDARGRALERVQVGVPGLARHDG